MVADTHGGWSTASAVNPVAPAIASGVDADSLRFLFVAAGNENTTYTTPAGFVLRGSKNLNRAVYVFEAAAPVAGPSLGSVTTTRSGGTGQGRSVQATVRPA
jgi:hypothetical protein